MDFGVGHQADMRNARPARGVRPLWCHVVAQCLVRARDRSARMAATDFSLPDGTKLFLPSNSSGQRDRVAGQPPKPLDSCDESSEARAWAERDPVACKIPESIRSDCYKAQVAGTSSLPRCLYASGPRAVALYRVTPGEEFAAARRVVPRDSH